MKLKPVIIYAHPAVLAGLRMVFPVSAFHESSKSIKHGKKISSPFGAVKSFTREVCEE